MSTLNDIAKLAKVSIASVSRALNNDTTYKMRTSTYKRIMDAANQLDYKKNTITNSNTDRSLKIGCILSITKDKYMDPYYMSILSGVETRLSELGFELAFLRTEFDFVSNTTLITTFNENISGIILIKTLNDTTYNYIKERVPHIVGIDTVRDDIDNIGYDHYDISTKAVKYLIKKGHTKIGFIGGSGSDNNISNSRRYRGYLAEIYASELTVNSNWVKDCKWDDTICMQQIKDICKLDDKPTAIFVASDLMAMAALSSLYEIGIKVPQEMSIIGLSNIELSKYSNPPLTTIEIPTKEIGIAAVDALFSRIEKDSLHPKNIFLPSTLVSRSSA